MRLLLAILLTFAIPFQGIANAHAIKIPCPMEAQGHAVMMQTGDMEGDCCNDAETAAKTGKLCKTGQECKVSPSLGLVPGAVLSGGTTIEDRISSPPQESRSFDLVSVWRPPALI